MKSILITGGAGYIGSHTAKCLAAAGYRPVVLDNLSTGHLWAVKWGPFIQGDVSDRRLVKRILREYEIEAVMHFAANAAVGESMRVPFKYLHRNVDGALELFEAMHSSGVRTLIFSSTCATYGASRRVPIRETAPQNPLNPYGESKLFIERALSWYQRAHNFAWCALRYFNAAGADPEGELGEDHDPETHVIPLVIQAALRGTREFTILGTDYATPDGTAIRDFVHVDDLASAHIKALEYLLAGRESRPFNIGTGRGHSVRDIIAAVERVSGVTVPVREGKRRPGDPPVLVAHNDRARSQLHWSPRYDNLDAIVQTAWHWHEAQFSTAAAAG